MNSRDSNCDAALRELQRALDAFIATHLATVANLLVSKKSDQSCNLLENDETILSETTTVQRDLKRLQCLSSSITNTRRRRGLASVASVAKSLLSWLHSVESLKAANAAATTAVQPSAVPAARSAEDDQPQSPLDPVASWLVAKLLKAVFQVPQKNTRGDISLVERSAIDEVVGLVVSRCLVAFQRSYQAEEEMHVRVRAGSSGNLLSYLTMRKAKLKTAKPPNTLTICLTCTKEASIGWGQVLGLAACLAPEIARIILQKEILTRSAAWNATKVSVDVVRHPYLKYLAEICLGLVPCHNAPTQTLPQRLPDAVRWLRVMMPLLLKPHRSHVRSACAHLIAHLLQRELSSLSRQDLSILYTSSNCDWSRCISDLHAAALRLTECARKKSRGRTQQQLEASSWALRAVVLALSPGEIFTRYWRDDALSLLKLQYHLNQDASSNGVALYNILPSLDLSFTYMMHRHYVVRNSGQGAGGIPTDSECMEIINTTQAWAFFSLPRLRPQSSSSFGSNCTAFLTIAVPALIHVTRVMASYNMPYTIQSHIRRLLAESVGVGDPQKLVGLQALTDLLQTQEVEEENLLRFKVNQNDLFAYKQMIGELVGRVLLECSTRLGHKTLTDLSFARINENKLQTVDFQDKDDDELWKNPNRIVAAATFAAALALMPILYAHISLSIEQKLSLLVRTAVNAERVVRRRAQESIVALVGPQPLHCSEMLPPSAEAVVRALTDYILRMNVSPSTTVSDTAGAITILQLLNALFAPSRVFSTRWASSRAQVESLIQVEATAVYLLVRGDDNIQAEQMLRLAVLETLEVAHEAKMMYCEKFTRDNTDQQPFDRLSVWTLLKKLDSELEIAFFTYKPHDANHVDEPSALRRLIMDTSTRHSFRWSLALARILTCVATHAPEVTAYIWVDVANKVTKLEPVLSVTMLTDDSLSNQRELSRWRNFALLSMIAAGPIIQKQMALESESSSGAVSAASSTMIASLVHQLACYLRSSNVGQRHAAILVLGHAGSVALSTLLDVLARLETEAFATFCKDEQESPENYTDSLNLTRARSTRATKLSKKETLELQHAEEAQVTLQCAIGRCFRLHMESWTRTESNWDELRSGSPLGERLCRAVSAHLQNMLTMFENKTSVCTSSTGSTEVFANILSKTWISDVHPELFVMQLDFLATYHSLLLYVNANRQSMLHMPNNRIATIIFGWCGNFEKDLAHASLIGHFNSGFITCDKDFYLHWIQLCDVSTACDGRIFYPWLWVENQAKLLKRETSRRVAQFFICHRAFSALAVLLRFNLQSHALDDNLDDDRIDTWLDACFRVDDVQFDYFKDLCHFARQALNALLELPCGNAKFHHAVRRRLEKATYSLTSSDSSEVRVARQYFSALGASTNVITFFRTLLHQLQEERAAVHDKDNLALAVRLVHVLLLHVGLQREDEMVQQHRLMALNIVAALVCELSENSHDDKAAVTRWSLQGYKSSSLDSLVAGRMQVTVSALLASHFSVLSLRVSLAILRSLSTVPLHNRLEITQQQQMLAAVLPWLAEVSLVTMKDTLSRPLGLLDLLYQLTAIHCDTCREQLDHSWLTLAFAKNEDDDSNAREVVIFLMRQQLKCQIPSETAKTVMWWLCRWQDAAPDVLRFLFLRPMSSGASETTSSGTAAALHELATLVTLASDTSCHLLHCSPSSPDVQNLAIHLMHVALTTLFVVQESDVVDGDQVNSKIRQQCHVLLHSILPLLEAPRRLLSEALNSIQAATSPLDKREPCAVFIQAFRSLTLCLSASETQIWSELCIQEIALAISPETSVPFESVEGIRRPSPPYQACVRFALVAYTQLSPRFQSDVLLSVLTLLRQTLTAGADVGRECLELIARLMQTMPDSKLVLYPQVFWVALALLTHCRSRRDSSSSATSSLHDGALKVLSIFWERTPFLRHAVVHEVIRYTRPAQWRLGTMHNSVLFEIVRCMHAGESHDSCARAVNMMQKAVVFVPCDLLGVSSRQHLVICTVSLFPTLVIPSNENNQVWNDLTILWQNSGIESRDQLEELLQMRERDCSPKFVSSFMTAFMSALDALELDKDGNKLFDGLDLSLEVLIACLPSPVNNLSDAEWSTSTDVYDKRCDLVFLMLEELLGEVLRRIETTKRTWKPVPELEATLARLLRSPKSERQWRLTMRVLTWVAEMTNVSESAVAPMPKSCVSRLKSSAVSGGLKQIEEKDKSSDISRLSEEEMSI
ncbi:uncharacterized protein PHALS_11517 [Plasmopara halstedii]|uniref:Uncharacterized protein n=1 Tax=Plasmopara halstedii TaxID=4781 RepID=A0A0P1A557_PLAHL|nr:uncharacterized protein PHALS_11517 [Plasmopara halstedii]CEG35647.1 hypothetical protein PHALS_11517 [Plasmopara halstedii]|eukprot:XP_024572016.1 hypothetical protein PHALS_11517 [Plasmopara halstedii]